jgi:formylglycine-generating enzyme required for sulfatase activity
VATISDPNGLYNSNMASGFAACGIVQNGSAGNFNYSVPAANQNFPVNYVSWGDTARFSNWLQNGEPTAPEGVGTTETGAYTLNGTNFAGVARNATATYVIPNEDEWYKAAYYAGGGTNAAYWLYPTQSKTPPINTLPDPGNHANIFDTAGTGNGGYTDPFNFLTQVGAFTNSPGAYGTYDMGGDVSQWDETTIGSTRIFRGGSFFHNSFNLQSSLRNEADPNFESNGLIGFRVASVVGVPEPSTAALAILACGATVWWKRRFKSPRDLSC